jgi:hypothetical protein
MRQEKADAFLVSEAISHKGWMFRHLPLQKIVVVLQHQQTAEILLT